MLIKRGDVFYADLDPIIGSEQGGIRPVLVVQNNVGNKYSPTVVVLPISSAKKNNMPTHIHICGSKMMPKDSIVLAEQIRTIDRNRLLRYHWVEGTERNLYEYSIPVAHRTIPETWQLECLQILTILTLARDETGRWIYKLRKIEGIALVILGSADEVYRVEVCSLGRV